MLLKESFGSLYPIVPEWEIGVYKIFNDLDINKKRGKAKKKKLQLMSFIITSKYQLLVSFPYKSSFQLDVE